MNNNVFISVLCHWQFEKTESQHYWRDTICQQNSWELWVETWGAHWVSKWDPNCFLSCIGYDFNLSSFAEIQKSKKRSGICNLFHFLDFINQKKVKKVRKRMEMNISTDLQFFAIKTIFIFSFHFFIFCLCILSQTLI